MSISSPEELAGLRAAGRVVSATLRRLRRLVRPGVTTAELDAEAARVFAAHGARSGPRLDPRFPGTICISVGDEAVHGIPGPRVLRAGELVTLDVTAELRGFYADACITVPVGEAGPQALALIAATEAGLRSGIGAARAGASVGAIGAAVEDTVEALGFTVCPGLNGHGIGRRIHEEPTVPNVRVRGHQPRLTEGLVIAIEPIVSAGGDGSVVADGPWVIRTRDGSVTAHAEHTMVITDGAPLLLTA